MLETDASRSKWIRDHLSSSPTFSTPRLFPFISLFLPHSVSRCPPLLSSRLLDSLWARAPSSSLLSLSLASRQTRVRNEFNSSSSSILDRLQLRLLHKRKRERLSLDSLLPRNRTKDEGEKVSSPSKLVPPLRTQKHSPRIASEPRPSC